MCSCAFDDIPIVDIDPAGVFKYIVLKVFDSDKRGNEENITIIRGYERHEFHSDLYDEIQEKLQPLFCEPLGGGRLVHKPHKKTIELYGRSIGYGKVDHEEAAKLIQKSYPDYKIKISKEESDEEEENEEREEGVEACDAVKAFVCHYPSEIKRQGNDDLNRSKRGLSDVTRTKLSSIIADDDLNRSKRGLSDVTRTKLSSIIADNELMHSSHVNSKLTVKKKVEDGQT